MTITDSLEIAQNINRELSETVCICKFVIIVFCIFFMECLIAFRGGLKDYIEEKIRKLKNDSKRL